MVNVTEQSLTLSLNVACICTCVIIFICRSLELLFICCFMYQFLKYNLLDLCSFEICDNDTIDYFCRIENNCNEIKRKNKTVGKNSKSWKDAKPDSPNTQIYTSNHSLSWPSLINMNHVIQIMFFKFKRLSI